MFDKIKLYTICCKTGCTCCAGDNFHRGFYKDAETALAVVAEYRRGIGYPLASQYARYGIYAVQEHEAELLPDGRVVIDDRVFESTDFVDRLCEEPALYGKRVE